MDSSSGNRTPVFRVTGGDTCPYTNEDCFTAKLGHFSKKRLSVRHREVLIWWHLTASLVGGLSFSCTAGRCPSPARKVGRWRGPGTRSAAATLDACRALLADHLSYGDRWGNPPAGA
ncbi:unnamed protein product [Pleuronectes platessa]|uniref:Uncharacterized protein n=1 Tax=Pleuronectes platessa TaxID=8262 RepID=A0A9N7YMV1_PLEPL|nr:unnamed protein product [Pleuronectes platessa]